MLNHLDDHSGLFPGSDAYGRVKAPDVVSSFQEAVELHGLPASFLSDNGAVFVGSYRGGKVLLEYCARWYAIVSAPASWPAA